MAHGHHRSRHCAPIAAPAWQLVGAAVAILSILYRDDIGALPHGRHCRGQRIPTWKMGITSLSRELRPDTLAPVRPSDRSVAVIE